MICKPASYIISLEAELGWFSIHQGSVGLHEIDYLRAVIVYPVGEAHVQIVVVQAGCFDVVAPHFGRAVNLQTVVLV